MPPKTYTLKPGIESTHRADFYLERGQTIDLDPTVAAKHADVLVEAKKKGGA